MLNKIRSFMGLVDEPVEVVPPQLGKPIDIDSLVAMRGGAVAIVDRRKGKIMIAIRRIERGYFGFVMEDGAFYYDDALMFDQYGKPDGWQAYTITPFEGFVPMDKGDRE